MRFQIFALSALAFLLALTLFQSQPNAQALDPYYARLNELNRLKPYQNPEWDRFDRVKKNMIVDNKSKVIGSLKGITLSQNGTVEALNVDLDRLKLGQTTLNYNAMRIRSGSASYILGFDDGAIKDNFASSLAAVEPAAGNSSSSINAASLKGASLEVTDGRRIGRVEEILFSSRNDRAEALVASINFRGVRASTLAIPFSSLEFEQSGNTYKVIMDTQQADALLKYAGRK